MPGAGTSTTGQNTVKQQTEAGNTASSTLGTTQQNQSQTQQQNDQSGPWAKTEPLLNNIIQSLGGMSTQPSPGQSEAAANLQTAANSIPSFGDPAAALTGDLFSSAPKYGGMLSGGLDTYKAGLSPYLSSSYLDPMSTPGLSDALGTMKSDITNQINSQFAAAGRDLSPGNTTALARGLSQGLAPVIANQFNQNVATQRGAQDAGFGATGNTGLMLAGFDQTALGNRLRGIDAANALPGVYTAPGSAQFGAANTAFGLPFSNLGMLEGLTLPVAGLGSTGSKTGTASNTGSSTTAGNTSGSYSGFGIGNSQTTGSQSMSPLAMLSSLFGGGPGGSAAGMGNAAGQGIGMLASLFA